MSTPKHDHDIYRGEPSQPQQPLYTAPSIISTSTTSSASSLLAASRLGAIAAKLELAISRWAKNVRGNSSSASESTSSHSSSSSIVTLTKSQHTRRRSRRSSVSSLRTLQSEREISARISRMKALEESRRIPRHFTLYLPLSISLPSPQNHSGTMDIENRQSTNQSLTSSTSLTLVLNQLDLAIKKAGKNRRTRQRHRNPPRNTSSLDFSSFPSQLVHDNQFGSGPDPRTPRGRKGKHRESSTTAESTSIMEEPMFRSQAWFLDVANPTWADLRAIGKLLHIHPLTLEDILQQDPREKLELFTNLGYYFISFRAIESKSTKERLQREAAASGDNWNFDEGSIGEANIYLTVFDDGICCFHFTDVSEHTDRVRNKIVLLQEDVDMSSDWIAHDILDSIVDSFFPFLEYVETEAMAIDNTVFAGTLNSIIPTEPPKVASMISGITKRTRTNTDSQMDEKYADNREFEDEKSQYSPRPRFVAPYLTVSHRTKRFISNAWESCRWRTKIEQPATPTTTPTPSHLTLRRIGSTRKLVTSLVRLLATKSDVLTAFRKQLLRASTLKPKLMTARSNEELAIYSGDVQDHILTLQHSLVYYERMLSDWNPTYISQLGAEISIAKNKADVKLLIVTTVALCCSTNLIVIGVFSMNVNLPTNLHAVGHPFFWFIGIIGMSILVTCILLLLVRHWWEQSKRRRFVG